MVSAQGGEVLSRQASYDCVMKKDPYSQFLTTLKEVRLKKDLSQSDLAKKIKLSRAQYTAIENGRSMITFRHLYNLSVALKTQFVIGRKSK
jgi:DNA-binding XRE family transcriptional regulator